ncbi:MAG TPA: response regulator FixJ [Acidocella sp.]|jgi:two-component system response regulator FixJ|nr:response regulator FixJ [Acidocella sp.]
MSDAVIHLIDDDDGVRHSLTFSLTAAGLAVRAYDSALVFLESVGSLQPGCIVSDMRMPGMDGLQLRRRLRELRVPLPMIIMTGHADIRMAVEAMKAGVADFIEKPFDDAALLAAIRDALTQSEATARCERAAQMACARLKALSNRERDVLRGLVAGLPNKSIASELKLSPRTVEVHRANVMTKMGANSLSELVRMAIATDILPTG